MRISSGIQKAIRCLLFLFIFTTESFAQNKSSTEIKSDSLYQCEVSCGTCMFKMKGAGCKLAVKINQQYYFVEGAGIDDFGDAHADDGFCNAIRKATIMGEIKKDVFVAKKITLSKD